MNDFLTITQIAEMRRVTRQAVWAKLQRWGVKPIKLGGLHLYKIYDVERIYSGR